MSDIIHQKAAALAAVPHGFLGKTGGVSKGIFASLNVGLGSSDDLAAVQENRARTVNAVLPGARLALRALRLHHGAGVYWWVFRGGCCG